MGFLPSIFELDEARRDAVRGAVAERVAGPASRGDVQSWDLSLLGDGFELLTCDPFSFWGDFLCQGLSAMAIDLLGPAGFMNTSVWIANQDGTEFHTTIGRMAGWRRSVDSG